VYVSLVSSRRLSDVGPYETLSENSCLTDQQIPAILTFPIFPKEKETGVLPDLVVVATRCWDVGVRGEKSASSCDYYDRKNVAA
jgi:hypothetical protein